MTLKTSQDTGSMLVLLLATLLLVLVAQIFFFFFFEKCHVCPDFVYLATDLCLHFSLVNNNVTALPYNLNTSYHQLI
jgi:hypothetical protein